MNLVGNENIKKNIKGKKSNPEQKQFNFICNQQYKIILTVMKLLTIFFRAVIQFITALQ